MANSYVEYTGTGTTGPFNVTFAYLSKAHVRVWNGLTEDTTFTWVSDTQIQTTSVVPAGVVVHIGRFSSPTTKLVDYQDAQQLTEATLDLDADQSFYLAQEAIDITDRTMTKPFGADYFDATSKKIKNIADGVDNNDAVNKAQVAALTAADVLLASQWATLLDALVASTDYSAKEWAIGTTVPSGSAKDWASQPSGTVDGSEFSAKKYAGDAATSESNASTSASAASSSASAAASSASAAAASEAAAATSYDNFDDRYLGQKASDPTLDNDGNALLTGALYFNTTSNQMKVYTGSAWKILDNTLSAPTASDDGKIVKVNDAGNGYDFFDLVAKGSIIVTDTNGRPLRLAVGSNDQVLVADSTQSGGVKWATPAGGGAWEVITEQTVSSAVSQVEFKNLPDLGLYDKVVLHWNDVRNATASVEMRFQVSTDNGSTYKSSADYFDHVWGYSADGTLINTGSGGYGATFSALTSTIDQISSTPYLSGWLELHNFQDSPNHSPSWFGMSMYRTANGKYDTPGTVIPQGSFLIASAVDAFRVYMSSGNISNGEWVLLGRKKA